MTGAEGLRLQLCTFSPYRCLHVERYADNLDRFAFLLGGNDGEFLISEDPP